VGPAGAHVCACAAWLWGLRQGGRARATPSTTYARTAWTSRPQVCSTPPRQPHLAPCLPCPAPPPSLPRPAARSPPSDQSRPRSATRPGLSRPPVGWSAVARAHGAWASSERVAGTLRAVVGLHCLTHPHAPAPTHQPTPPRSIPTLLHLCGCP